jgi:hypothetical protein
MRLPTPLIHPHPFFWPYSPRCLEEGVFSDVRVLRQLREVSFGASGVQPYAENVMDGRSGMGTFRKLTDRYNRYDVVDANGDKVGTVDVVYAGEGTGGAQREYVAVKRGLAGLIPGTGSSLIPLDICTIDNTTRTIRVNAQKDAVTNSPSLSTNQEMTPEYEGQVRSYYRL